MSVMVDMGKFIFILIEGERDPLVLDKSDKDFNYKVGVLKDIHGLKGSSERDKILLESFKQGNDYNKVEKWLNLGISTSCMYYHGIVKYTPVFDTSDFTKDEVKKIVELALDWGDTWRAIQRMNNIMWAKEFLKKRRPSALVYSLMSYVKDYERGYLSMETFLTFNTGKMDDEIQYFRQMKVAKECENILDFPYELEEDLGDYVLTSPKSYRELVEVGFEMRNCLGGYPRWVCDGMGANKILFIKEKGNDEVFIALEVQGIMIQQALKKFNKIPSEEEMVLIDAIIEDHGWFKSSNFNAHGYEN